MGQRPHRVFLPEEYSGRKCEGCVFKNGQGAAGGTLLAAFTQPQSRSSDRGWGSDATWPRKRPRALQLPESFFFPPWPQASLKGEMNWASQKKSIPKKI